MHDHKETVGIIGLGYVGLPLLIQFAEKYKTLGFDLDNERITELQKGIDRTLEVETTDLMRLKEDTSVVFSYNPDDLKDLDYYIICVPTPIRENNEPDLSALISASNLVGRFIKAGSTIVFESTVYPGATEEVCVPVIEKVSGLYRTKGFFYGYSPERINPGDKERDVTDIVKVTSGCCELSAKKIDDLYKSIIRAGTFQAKSVAVAEAAKVFENVQRDVNIALVNELSILCNKLGIKSADVLDAASTKWNFHKYAPGLVGGHCIGVDPYYLIDRGKSVGIEMGLIEKARKINESVVFHIVDQLKTDLLKKKICDGTTKLIIFGYTFKEDCPDTRNTKVHELANQLSEIVDAVDIFDPHVSSEEIVNDQYKFVRAFDNAPYDVAILAVNHTEFQGFDRPFWDQLLKKKHIIYDLKNSAPCIEVDFSL